MGVNKEIERIIRIYHLRFNSPIIDIDNEDFFVEFVTETPWSVICQDMGDEFSDEFIDEFQEYLDWEKLMVMGHLTEYHIRDHIVRLKNLCKSYLIIEKIEKYGFMEEFDLENNSWSNWTSISFESPMSEDFIRRHIKKISLPDLAYNTGVKLSDEFLIEFGERMELNEVTVYKASYVNKLIMKDSFLKGCE